VAVPLRRALVTLTTRVPEVRQKAGGGAHRNVQVAGGRCDATPLLPHHPHQVLPRLHRFHRVTGRATEEGGSQVRSDGGDGGAQDLRVGLGGAQYLRGASGKRQLSDYASHAVPEIKARHLGWVPAPGVCRRLRPVSLHLSLDPQQKRSNFCTATRSCMGSLENLRVGERRPEHTTGCMNASLNRNCGSETPDFSTIQGATGVTTHPANPTQSGGRRARTCRRVVLSGNTRPGRKPRRAHAHGVDRGKTPRATNTSCVTGSLLARVEGLEATLTPRPLIPSVPLRPSENPPSDTLKGPSENPPSDTLKGTSENPPLRAHGASLTGGRSKLRTPP